METKEILRQIDINRIQCAIEESIEKRMQDLNNEKVRIDNLKDLSDFDKELQGEILLNIANTKIEAVQKEISAFRDTLKRVRDFNGQF